VLNPAVETLSDPQLGYVLSWKAGAGRTRGWRAWLAGPALRRRLQLDELGRRTVELIDGRRRVGEIAVVLAAERQIAPADMQRAVLSFLARLVRRRIVQIVAGEAAAAPGAGPLPSAG